MPSENGAVQTGDDSACLLHHMQQDPDLDDEPWEILEREARKLPASSKQLRLYPLYGCRSGSSTMARSDDTPDSRTAKGDSTQSSTGGVSSHLPDQAPNVVHWLPTEPEQCHKALRHYAADVNVNDLELGAVTSVSSVFTVQQPQPEGGNGVYRPCQTGCSRQNGTPAPSSRRLFWALVLAVVSTVACGGVAGLAALVMVNKAKRRREEGQYTDARQWLDYAFAIIAVSVFICTPIYVYLIVYQNHLF